MNIGALDQLLAALNDLSTAVMDYNKKLRAAGFSKDEALVLTVNFQNSMMNNSKSGGK